MTTFIVLTDGRAWLSSNGMFDEVMEAVAGVLPADGKELADWLLGQRCTVMGPGVGSLDLRDLTGENQRRFLDALPEAMALSKARVSARGVAEVERLLLMIDDPTVVDRNVTGIIPHEGERNGPGW